MNDHLTICWNCANACGGCSWSDHWLHKPVEGWTATRRDLRTHFDGNVVMIESYVVHSCPEFVRDAWDGGARKVGEGESNLHGLQIGEG